MNTLIPHTLLVVGILFLTGCETKPTASVRTDATVESHVDPFQDASPAPVAPRDVAVKSSSSQKKPLPRPEIVRVEDLPVRYYPVPESATEFMASDELFGEVSESLRVDITSDLEVYDIKDRAGLRQLHSTLMNIAIIQERYDDARVHIESIRALHTDPVQAQTTGLMMGAIIDAWEQGGRDNPATLELYTRHLSRRVDALPWEVVEEDIVVRQQNAGRMDPAIFSTIIATGLDPMFKQDGRIDSTVARQLVTLKSILDIQMPVMDQTSAVYLEAIEAHAGD